MENPNYFQWFNGLEKIKIHKREILSTVKEFIVKFRLEVRLSLDILRYPRKDIASIANVAVDIS